MITGRYEIRVYFDVDKLKLKKELVMGDNFEDSTQFVAKLLSDLQAAGPMIDKYIPTSKDEDKEEKEDAHL